MAWWKLNEGKVLTLAGELPEKEKILYYKKIKTNTICINSISVLFFLHNNFFSSSNSISLCNERDFTYDGIYHQKQKKKEILKNWILLTLNKKLNYKNITEKKRSTPNKSCVRHVINFIHITFYTFWLIFNFVMWSFVGMCMYFLRLHHQLTIICYEIEYFILILRKA